MIDIATCAGYDGKYCNNTYYWPKPPTSQEVRPVIVSATGTIFFSTSHLADNPLSYAVPGNELVLFQLKAMRCNTH